MHSSLKPQAWKNWKAHDTQKVYRSQNFWTMNSQLSCLQRYFKIHLLQGLKHLHSKHWIRDAELHCRGKTDWMWDTVMSSLGTPEGTGPRDKAHRNSDNVPDTRERIMWLTGTLGREPASLGTLHLCPAITFPHLTHSCAHSLACISEFLGSR